MYNRYYNILDQEIHKQLYERVFNGKWNLTNVSDPRLDKTNFWYQDLNDDKLITVNLFNLLKQKINDNNDSFKLLRVYANGQTHGQCGSWHTDQDDSGHYTLLYYLNLEWDMEWGGSTVFKNEQQGTYDNAFFIPNSAILFDSTLEHVGLEPTSKFNGLRMTIAYKLKRV